MKSYPPFLKSIHWLVALIVIPMVLGSFYIDSLPKSTQGTVILFHKSFGLLILLLMVMRLIALHKMGRPALPLKMPFWEKTLARVVQYLLYLSLIVMPLIGWIMSTAAGRSPNVFGLFILPFPGIVPNEALSDTLFQAHRFTAFVIIGLLVLHIIGAWKHYLVDKDNVMQSMLP